MFYTESTAPSSPWTCQVLVQLEWKFRGAKVLLALADASTLRGPRLKCSGARTLHTPVSPRQLYTDHPTRAPSPKGQEIPTLLCRRLQRVQQEGSNLDQLNQWPWEFGQGKPRLGGLSVAETEARRLRIAVM